MDGGAIAGAVLIGLAMAMPAACAAMADGAGAFAGNAAHGSEFSVLSAKAGAREASATLFSRGLSSLNSCIANDGAAPIQTHRIDAGKSQEARVCRVACADLESGSPK